MYNLWVFLPSSCSYGNRGTYCIDHHETPSHSGTMDLMMQEECVCRGREGKATVLTDWLTDSLTAPNCVRKQQQRQEQQQQKQDYRYPNLRDPFQDTCWRESVALPINVNKKNTSPGEEWQRRVTMQLDPLTDHPPIHPPDEQLVTMGGGGRIIS